MNRNQLIVKAIDALIQCRVNQEIHIGWENAGAAAKAAEQAAKASQVLQELLDEALDTQGGAA